MNKEEYKRLYELKLDENVELSKEANTYLKALLDIKILVQHYGNEEKILDTINKALGDKENEYRRNRRMVRQ